MKKYQLINNAFLALLITQTFLLSQIAASEGASYAARPASKYWGQKSGINYACHKGSDEHCKKALGEEYCCASYRSLAQSRPTYAYVCTKVEEILEEGGKIEEDLVEGIVYKVMCADAQMLFVKYIVIFTVSFIAILQIISF